MFHHITLGNKFVESNMTIMLNSIIKKLNFLSFLKRDSKEKAKEISDPTTPKITSTIKE